MNSRRKKSHESYHRSLEFRERYTPVPKPSTVISVPVYLPLPVALKARRKIYTYPLLAQKRLNGRVIRTPLKKHRGPVVLTKVRVRIPRRLPAAKPSYVSISRGKLNVHSRLQLRRLLAAGENNRRRYQESKTNRRRARYGQLESRGSTAFGAVAAAAQNGYSTNRIADTALAVRAILGGR